MFTFNKKTRITFIYLILAIPIFCCGCLLQNTYSDSKLTKQNYVLGTIVTITLYDHQSEELIDTAFDKLSELENILSVNKTNTLIDSINQNAGIMPVKVDEATFNLIKTGIHYSELTSGAFDMTIGPLVKLWNIGFTSDDSQIAPIPSHNEIESLLPLVDYHFITLDETAQTVYLEKSGMQLDLGSIGKGYAADEIASLLREAGVEHATIDLGGNVYVLGNTPNQELWTIGIQDPFNPRGNTIGSIKGANKSIVTSGIYERYITAEDGTEYHHILDPSTGYPFDNEIIGVSIISDSSTDGDALSTATFALGLKDGMTFIESLENIDAIFITKDKKVYVTSGIKDSFNLTNTDFTLAQL